MLDGTGDYVTASASTDFDFGTGDFTVECWIKTTFAQVSFAGIVVRAVATSGNERWGIVMNGNGIVTVFDGGFGAGNLTNVRDGNWNHIAWCRSGSINRLFVNGVSGLAATVPFTVGAGTGTVRVGQDPGVATRVFKGNIDEVRITKGFARYEANFTPPTDPFPDI